MEHTIRSISVYISVLVFFAMAVAGWIAGATPATCSYRAVIGAVIACVVVNLACRLVVKTIIEEIIQQKADQVRKPEQPS